MINTFSSLESSLKQQVNNILANNLAQHISFKLLLTKDICYCGKVFKIIATNNIKDEPNRNDNPYNKIDYRYMKEQMIIVIPLQTCSSVEELDSFINEQVNYAIQCINKQFA